MTTFCRMVLAGCAFVAIASAQSASRYPAHWWAPVQDNYKPDWEILPQAAKPGEVILSKRNELGILSNFAATPFSLAGAQYASVEGFWQMMLYPEDASDPRATTRGISWRFTRQQVAQMTSFEAKNAGTLAEENMRKLGIDWVTFNGQHIPYRSMTKGEHYRLIREAMLAKLQQNPPVRKILLSTGDLILRPDHIQERNAPPEWVYFQIWMEIRRELQRQLALGSVEFSDQPDFVVAGVRETPYSGAHGSETAVRSAESLSRATASLRNRAPATGLATETSLLALLGRNPRDAALHHSLASLEERLGKPLEAVREYQNAAELEASENNLFDWGTELLVHDAPHQAGEVFDRGIGLYPRSSRMLLGGAVAAFTQSRYSQAAELFYRASDLEPAQPGPYLFLGNVQTPEITDTTAYRERLTRFVQLQPENAWANYLYATTLCHREANATTSADVRTRIQSALENAVRLDPTFALAWLQLGIVHAQAQDFATAAQDYEKAIAADPNLEQAHYRLAAAYRKLGETAKAQRETDLFNRLAKDSAHAREQERSNLQRFVVQLKTAGTDY